MSWSEKQSLRLQLSKLGQSLTALKNAFETVSDLSSKMVAGRINRVSADYWKAVDAYSNEDFEKAGRLVTVGLLEAGFVAKLMEAETTERELGESQFFEYADKSDKKSSLERINDALDLIAIELGMLHSDCKKRMEP